MGGWTGEAAEGVAKFSASREGARHFEVLRSFAESRTAESERELHKRPGVGDYE